MMLTASDVSSLAESLSRWELGEYISEAFVIVACAGELVADLERKCLTRAHRDRIERLSTILLVAALSASLICLVRTNELSGRVIGSLRDIAADAAAKAQEALSDSTNALTQSGQALDKSNAAKDASAKAQQKADAVANKADDLLKKYVAAENELLKLQFLVVPREQLLMGKARSFVKAVVPFAGQKIEIRTNPSGISDPNDVEEMRLFVFTIEFLLGQVSGWSISETHGDNGWGITLAVRRNSSPETRNAANALASAFGDCGLTDMQGARPVSRVADAGSVIDRENGPPETIVLFIGRHPR